ncbi:PAS domain-containing protein [Evansella vedderi]|uniref:PAS domain-containing protein n=1 Tax=Evansella vedderi TaxID=38282 RepID=A0ABT9ZPQ0_9BACI|nr:hypothetical protein [Evansella vedderi]MDQ0252687.1 PAS domain-containing protein [Evansella vedderi]
MNTDFDLIQLIDQSLESKPIFNRESVIFVNQACLDLLGFSAKEEIIRWLKELPFPVTKLIGSRCS